MFVQLGITQSHTSRKGVMRCYPPNCPCGGAITPPTKLKKKKNRRRNSRKSRRREIEMAASIKSRLGLIVRLANSVLKPPQSYLVTNLLYFVTVYARYVRVAMFTACYSWNPASLERSEDLL